MGRVVPSVLESSPLPVLVGFLAVETTTEWGRKRPVDENVGLVEVHTLSATEAAVFLPTILAHVAERHSLGDCALPVTKHSCDQDRADNHERGSDQVVP